VIETNKSGEMYLLYIYLLRRLELTSTECRINMHFGFFDFWELKIIEVKKWRTDLDEPSQ